MKYAHIADVHMGGWRDPKMRELSFSHFDKAISTCVEEGVDFLLIAGDLFNTSFPSIEAMNRVTKGLRTLKDNNIRVYAIAGSHDFSPSGKTMIDVLETAGLLINVAKGEVVDGKLKLKFTEDISGAKITGIPGRANMLDKKYYEELIREDLELESGYKIFMFHTALTELKPKGMEKMESQPVSLLPKNFDYYAGGHVHITEEISLPGYRNIVYPGPVFPNSFSELEELQHGGMAIVEDGIPRRIKIKLIHVVKVPLFFDFLTPEEIRTKLFENIGKNNLKDAIALVRITGRLSEGKIADIKINEALSMAYEKGAYIVMKSISIKSKEFESIKIDASSAEDIESRLVSENPKSSLIISLMHDLSAEKREGENSADFEKRILDAALKTFENEG